VQAWFDRLLPGKPTMRAHVYGTLVGVYQQAVKDRLRDRSPCRVEGGMSKERQTPEREIPTLEQIAAMVEATPPRFRLMLLIAAYCGLRYGEIAELRRRDVDPETGLIRVRRAVIRPRTGPVVKPPKSRAGQRDVFMPDWMLDDLRQHLDEHARPGLDGLLFANYRGEQLSYSGRDMWWVPAKRAAGWDGSFHDLRHVALTLFAYQGATTKELMARAGHTTPGMSMRYQQAAAERDRQLANAMPRPGGNVVPIAAKRRRRKTG
jgi:integrase